jgi:hypothetical protein
MNARTLAVLMLATAALLLPPAAHAGDEAPAAAGEAAASAAFDRLKSLAGEWRGQTGDGKPATLTYTVIAGGHTVMEVYRAGSAEQAMYTLYHLDGERLMLTHYCVSNNQPRMQADLSGAPGEIRFAFFDATNLDDPNDGHMHRALIRFHDDDHISNAWTFRSKGADAFTETTDWERAR